jgi:NADH:ubiquinone oxidoreductase subunit 3 (subunit A)
MLTSDFAVCTCDPIRGFWDKSIPSKYIDTNRFYIGITIPNILFDVATVVLQAWHLHLNREQKWAITNIFLLGGRYIPSFCPLLNR